MPPTRTLASLTPLSRLPTRNVQSRLLPLQYQAKQSRSVAQDHSQLGGPGGSEPPGPQPNKHNWIAGTITVTAVLFIGWRMRVAKTRQEEEGKA
ncbi:hypothetical protein QBC34DRAFT_87660 [Podospora aff. communis PSN243]|uniref:Uncharacterized protein n=1 Tax=Podospora aff. communis PSN243 TaxID=3040156 RepID=A0AAV9GP02_9PEZI|nr:hypothetical protein QBC34DRAFT_87660 [Podospora aff. communis PSN243]